MATLEQEHELILRVLAALEMWSAEVQRRGDDARAELGRFLVFFHHFVDGAHHTKEEEVLFRALLRREDGTCRQLLAELLREHEDGRALLGPLEDLAYQAHPWSDADRERLGEAGRAYERAQREHVEKENRVLLPLCREGLDAHSQRRVARELVDFDVGEDESVARARRIAEELVARYALRHEHVQRATSSDELTFTPR